jgi:hypothetical protein
MICECICHCQNLANDTREPRLCLACSLMAVLGSAQHGLPYVPTVWPKLEPLEPISDAMKDKAIENALDGVI